MATACLAQLTFKCYPKTTMVARFDQAQASTDGGGRCSKRWMTASSSRTVWRRACPIIEIPTRSGPRSATCCASVSSVWRVGMRTAMTRPGWPTIPGTSWRWGATRGRFGLAVHALPV